MVTTPQTGSSSFPPSAARLQLLNARLQSVRHYIESVESEPLLAANANDLLEELNELYEFLQAWWEAIWARADTDANAGDTLPKNDAAFDEWLLVAEAVAEKLRTVSSSLPNHPKFSEYLEERRAARELAARPAPTAEEHRRFLAGGEPIPQSWFDEEWPEQP
jgi:hypothetical protein